MQILITGATGFLGMPLCKTLIDAGHKVRALVRPRPQDDSRTLLLKQWGVDVVSANLLSKDAVTEAMQGIDTLYHLAWKTNRLSFSSAGATDDSPAFNLAAVDVLIRSAEASGVQRMVFTSSVAVYGPASDWGPVPRHEADARPDLGSHRSGYFRTFGAAKLRAEELLRARETTLDHVILRPNVVYGPGVEFAQQVIEGAKSPARRDAAPKLIQWVHLDDMVTALVQAGVAPDAVGKTLNIAGSHTVPDTTLRDALQHLLEIGDAKQEPDWTPRVPRFDISAAERALGFAPKVDWTTGLAGMLDANDVECVKTA